ncbi:MAG: alanine dehydrogenase [Bacteroidales bacterium]|jgi:alanine dehydrogenase|nr:alanine dehydrogenase [Bacteroidales bacterium]
MDEKETGSRLNIGNTAFMPREELLEIKQKTRKIRIGIPLESESGEKRVALTPEAVNLLVDNGNEVILQKGAGIGSKYADTDYSEHGTRIVTSASEVFDADVVIKVAPFNEEEAGLTRSNQIVMSYLNVLKLNEETLTNLIRKKVTAFSFERIMDKDGMMPVIESMSEISGITSVLIASEHLSSMHGGKGIMLGGITGITPTDVVIIGANTAGEYAARAALGLGARVKVFDNSVNKLRRFQNLVGQRLETSVFHPQVLVKSLKSADVLIGAIELEDLRPWYYISEDMIMMMKKGSVVIDLSIDRGGCIETTECREMQDPVYEKHGVIHFSAWNLPSRVARTATIALSNIFTPMLQHLADSGGITPLLKNNNGLRHGVYLYNGILTNETLGQKFGILSKDIDLLLAAF